MRAGADLPAPVLTAWVSAWAWAAAPMITVPLAIFLFPDGHAPSHRWHREAHFSNPIGVPGPAGQVGAGDTERQQLKSLPYPQRTLEAFTARLRDEVELEAVGDALVATAGRAVRPTAGVVWLRSGAGR